MKLTSHYDIYNQMSTILIIILIIQFWGIIIINNLELNVDDIKKY